MTEPNRSAWYWYLRAVFVPPVIGFVWLLVVGFLSGLRPIGSGFTLHAPLWALCIALGFYALRLGTRARQGGASWAVPIVTVVTSFVTVAVLLAGLFVG